MNIEWTMNNTVKQLWLEALRSGEYSQAKGSLRKGDAFCCLGVLCDLYQKTTGKGEWQKSQMEESANQEFVINTKEGFDEGSSTILTESVYRWAGLNPLLDKEAEDELVSRISYGCDLRSNPVFYVDHVQFPHSLASLNDLGAPFEEIAEKIEAMFTGVE